MIDPLPSINKVYSLLIQDESQRAIGHSTIAYVESTALATKASSGFGYGGGNASGHVGKGNKNKGKQRPVCSHYGITGYVSEKCYKLHGIPPAIREKERIQWLIKLEVLILGSWTQMLCLNNSLSYPSKLFSSLQISIRRFWP